MGLKKRSVLLFVVLLLLINLVSLWIITDLTGYLTQTAQGELSLCLDQAPTITAIADQSAIAGNAFSYQVVASDDDDTSLSYYDNTTLFDISTTGLISFTTTSANIGSNGIEIKVEDNTGCSNYNSTTTFKLVITAPAAEEAPTPAAGEAGGGGGGGGGKEAPASLIVDDFWLSEEMIKIGLKQTQRSEKEVTVGNRGEEPLKIEISNPLPGLVAIYPTSFTLLPGEEKELILTFNPREEADLGVYFGQVAFKVTRGEMHVKEYLSLVLEIESEEVLFDASLDLAEKILTRGDKLKMSISLFNLKRSGTEEVKLVYNILDGNNQAVYEEEEKLTVEERVSFTKEISLPENLPAGQYLLSLKILAGESFATATEMFELQNPLTPLQALAAPITEKPLLIVSLLPVIAILLVVVLVVLFMMQKRIKKQKTIIKSDDGPRLRKKLWLLEDSFRKGFIKEDTYLQTRAGLEKMLKEEERK